MNIEQVKFELKSNQDELRRYTDRMTRSRTILDTGKLQLYNNNIARLKSDLARLKAAAPTTTGPTAFKATTATTGPNTRQRSKSRGKHGGSKKRNFSRKRRTRRTRRSSSRRRGSRKRRH